MMIRATRRAVLLATTMVAAAGASTAHAQEAAPAAATPTSAPTPGASTDPVLGDIVVTARKREESLQAVPLTITAFSARAIEASDIKDMYDVAIKTPGLYFGTTGGRAGGNKLQIRNLSTGTAGGSKASVFIDGVYVSGDYSSTPLANLERVEVLKGPQSAYFGRSTFVGAVNFVTRDPGNDFTGKIDMIGATLGEADVSGFVTTPIVNDILSNVVSFRYFTFTGPDRWRNTNDDYHFGNQSTLAISDKLVLHAGDHLKISAYASYVHDRDHIPATTYLPMSARNLVVQRPDGTQSRYFSGPVDFDYNPSYYHERIRGYFDNPGVERNQYRGVLSVEADIAGQQVTGFAAFGDEKLRNDYDGFYLGSGTEIVPDKFGVPTPYTYTASNALSRVRTQDRQYELRLSAPADWRLRYLIGGNHTRIYGSNKLLLDTVSAAGVKTLPAPLLIVSNSNTILGNPARTDAIFGALYFDLNDRITISAEARHQWERIRSQNLLLASSSPFYDLSTTFEATLPRFNVQYKVDPTLQFYAVYARGNNPGGFNTSIPPANLPAGVSLAFGEEKLSNYEAGFKSVWLDGKLLINAAVYHMDWSPQQVLQSYLTNFPATGSFTGLTTATAKSKVTGFEYEIQAIPAEGLDLRATGSYGKAKYVNYCSSNYYALTGIATGIGCRSVAGNQQEGTPALQLSFEADYSRPIDDRWNGYVRADYQYQSKVYFDEFNFAWTPPANVANVRIGAESGNVTLEAFVRNLFDDDHSPRATRAVYASPTGATAAAFTYPAINGTPAGGAAVQNVGATPRKPRQLGVRLGYRF